MLEVIVINYGDSMDATLDGTRNGINNSKNSELYFNENQTIKFYKSANPYYDKWKFLYTLSTLNDTSLKTIIYS